MTSKIFSYEIVGQTNSMKLYKDIEKNINNTLSLFLNHWYNDNPKAILAFQGLSLTIYQSDVTLWKGCKLNLKENDVNDPRHNHSTSCECLHCCKYHKENIL